MTATKPLALLVLAALTAAACTPPPSASPAEKVSAEDLPPCPVDALDAATGPVDISFWHSELAVMGETVDQMVADYNASQDKVRLTAQFQGLADEMLSKYTSAASTHQLPDLVEIGDTLLESTVDGGTILPAESCMRAAGFDLDSIDPAVRAYFTVDDIFWPGFVSLGAPMLYYNRRHFEEAGLDPDDAPRTLEELADTARALKDAGVSPKPISLVLTRWTTVSWLNGIGADLVDNDNGRDGRPTKPTFDRPETRELLQTLHDMKAEGLLQPYSPDQINHLLALANEDSTMTIESSVAASSLQAFLQGTLDPGDAGAGADPGSVDTGNLQLGSGPFPGMEDGATLQGSGPGWYIVRESSPEKQAAAWDFLQWMLRPENVVKWHLGGSGLPFVQGAADDPAIQEFWDTQIAGGVLEVAHEQYAAIDPDNPGPMMGPYFAFTKALDVAIQDVLLSDKDIDAAIAAAQAEMEAAFERYYG
jgi:sn-glycerol 3-phosphate transport system substrate-binding protein